MLILIVSFIISLDFFVLCRNLSQINIREVLMKSQKWIEYTPLLIMENKPILQINYKI